MNVTTHSNPLARVFAVFGRGFRAWREEQLMPSMLFDLNRSLGEDVGIVPQDAIEAASNPRARSRRGSP